MTKNEAVSVAKKQAMAASKPMVVYQYVGHTTDGCEVVTAHYFDFHSTENTNKLATVLPGGTVHWDWSGILIKSIEECKKQQQKKVYGK